MRQKKRPKLYDIITFSDMCVDLILTGADVSPEFGQVEKLLDDYTLELGGSCNIFACQCAKLGLRTAVLGRIGEDSFGGLILRRLQENGVDTRHVIVDPSLKTGIGVALCPPGDRAILTYIGTINAVYPGDVTDDILASTRHVHHGSFYLHTNLLPAIPDIFQRAQALGATTSLDTNWDPADAWEANLAQILPHTDVFMPNDQEALRIFLHLSGGLVGRASLSAEALAAQPSGGQGCPPYEEQSSAQWALSEVAHYYLGLGVRCVTIKAGKEGAAIYTPDQVWSGRPRPVTGGDSIGAGDSFDAGFLSGWLRGYDLQKCLDISLACGSAVAGQIGGLAGQPTWQMVV